MLPMFSIFINGPVVLPADIRVHEFFKTPYFKRGIHPIPGARLTLEKLSTYCDLSVVT